MLAACTGPVTSTTSQLPYGEAPPNPGLRHDFRRACRVSADPNLYHCDVLFDTTPALGHLRSNVSGYGPPDLQSAYKLPSSTHGAGQTIAVVDAFDDPNVDADLATYRSTYGLPACTSGSGCFRKLNQDGKPGPYPLPNAGWALEESLDTEMVSAVCPNCHIILMEADDNTLRSLGKAEDMAVQLGANVISNSFGGGGSSGGKYFNHPGVIITASAGDNGYGIQNPADLPTVVSVGGTVLLRDNNPRGWNDVVWSGTGSGCAHVQMKPSWQTDRGCSGRTMNDVAALATNAAVYDTYYENGWTTVEGTSISAPVVAAIYGLAENASSLNAAQSLYAPNASLYDVVSGSNGVCNKKYLCNAKPGYDGPSGNGTPDGVSAF